MLGCSVRQAQAQINSREYAEWLAFDRLSPIGGERADYHAAQIVSAVLNVNRGRRQKAISIPDCLLHWGPKAKRTWQEIKARMTGWLRTRKKARKKRGK